MCLIAYATTPDAVQSIRPGIVDHSWPGNPHGMGIAYRMTETDPVRVCKGFMDKAAARKAIARVQKRKPVEMAIHFRFGTSGGMGRSMTHPFIMAHGALLHNGILALQGTKGESDTARAARMLYDSSPGDLEDMMKPLANGSRLLYMAHKAKQSWRSGHWYKSIIAGLLLSQEYTLPELIDRPKIVNAWPATSAWNDGDYRVGSATARADAEEQRRVKRLKSGDWVTVAPGRSQFIPHEDRLPQTEAEDDGRGSIRLGDYPELSSFVQQEIDRDGGIAADESVTTSERIADAEMDDVQAALEAERMINEARIEAREASGEGLSHE